MVCYDLSVHSDKIFFEAPSSSVLWLRGMVPDDVPGVPGIRYGDGRKDDEYLVPFRVNDYAFNPSHFGFKNSFLKSSECFDEIGQFAWHRNLSLKREQPVQLFLREPPNPRFQKNNFITVSKDLILRVMPYFS